MAKDKDGALWFGTLGGVGRYDTLTWQALLLNQTIVGIADGPGGRLWVATAENGLRYLEHGEWGSLTADGDSGADDLPGNWMEVLYQTSDGVLWAGTNTFGLARYDGRTWHTFTQAEDGLASDVITAMYEAPDGTLWVGTTQGLSRYRDADWETLDVGAECGLDNDVVLAIAQDEQGILWIGTQAGLCRFDGQQWLEPITRATSGLAANEVRAVLPNGAGSLWFGTWAGGVNRYDGEGWSTYTVADGLATNAILSIMKDSNGALWFGTLNGVTRYDGRTWLSYTTADGLTSNVVRVIYEDAQGVVWMGTERGLSRYDADPGLPTAHVSSLNGMSYEGGGLAILTGNPLVIDFDGGDLRTRQEDLVFLCRLEGMDTDWRPCGRISYPELPWGRYVFHLTVRDEDFNYSPVIDLPITVNRGVALQWSGRSFVVPASVFAIVVSLTVTAAVGLGLFAYTRRQTRRRGRGALQRQFNPYISGEPVRREDMFFGRHDLMHHILHVLHNNSIMIHGERRIGKTTLLYQLANRLREEPDPNYLFVPVLVGLVPHAHGGHRGNLPPPSASAARVGLRSCERSRVQRS
jgi:hypothetical protein